MNLIDVSDGILEIRPFRPRKGSDREVYRLDTANQCLWRRKQRVLFDPKAFAVLSVLVEQAGQLVTKNELLDTVWASEIVCESVIKFQIGRIRALLRDTPKKPRFIETVHCRGYRFVGRLSIAKPQAANTETLIHDFIPRLPAEQELTFGPH